MINFDFDEKSLTDFGRRFRSAKQKQIHIALNDIRRVWHAELLRQHKILQGFWLPLDRRYAKRKEHEFYSFRLVNRPTLAGRFLIIPSKTNTGSSYSQVKKVNYLKILQRSGKMLDGYLKGIRVDTTGYKVTIPYPEGAVGVRAKAHQGAINAPVGMPERRFLVGKFQESADTIIRSAINSNKLLGSYQGFKG